MNAVKAVLSLGVVCATWVLVGCQAPTIDFSTIQRPARAVELDAYDVFVGTWKWDATVLNAKAGEEKWSGSAEWKWALDKYVLEGHLSARGAHAAFDADGIWSWHPKAKDYMWWMFNNWGFPQAGTARYDAATQTWRMPYKSVGLDGTYSYGLYTMQVKDKNTLDWTMTEWADALHCAKKIEMKGTYTRQK